jgi:hypothetical protein
MSGRPFRRVARFLLDLSLPAALGLWTMTLGAETPSRPPSAPAAGVLATVRGEVAIDRPGGARPIAGTIGMRLMPGDGLRVGAGSSATVYLAGGSIVRVPAGGRIEIPQGPGGVGAAAGVEGAGRNTAGSATAPAMSSRSVEVLEQGLWVLNDPEGSVLLSAMRGENDVWEDVGAGGPLPLSPRFETVLDPRPRFVWRPASGPVRIALAHGKDVLWRGPATAASSLRLPEDAPKLRAGEAYRWWLESGDGGVPLGEGVPFRLAGRDVQTDAARFESEVGTLERGDDGTALADLLRCGYYVKIGAWTRVLEAASAHGERDAPSPVATRAIDGCRRQMRLTQDGIQRLVALAAGRGEVDSAP